MRVPFLLAEKILIAVFVLPMKSGNAKLSAFSRQLSAGNISG